MVDEQKVETYKLYVEIELPEGTTIGDLIETRGALSDAAATYVDWEQLYNRDPNAIGSPGLILLGLAHGLREAERVRGL